MNPKMLKAMAVKKKRPVDPNAPPRPNLMSHDKTIRDMATANAVKDAQLAEMQQRMIKLERKVLNLQNYVDALHQRVVLKK